MRCRQSVNDETAGSFHDPSRSSEAPSGVSMNSFTGMDLPGTAEAGEVDAAREVHDVAPVLRLRAA